MEPPRENDDRRSLLQDTEKVPMTARPTSSLPSWMRLPKSTRARLGWLKPNGRLESKIASSASSTIGTDEDIPAEDEDEAINALEGGQTPRIGNRDLNEDQGEEKIPVLAESVGVVVSRAQRQIDLKKWMISRDPAEEKIPVVNESMAVAARKPALRALSARQGIGSWNWDHDLTTLMGNGRKSALTTDGGRLRWRHEDQRPYAEPPLFDYERFNKEFIPSDKMMAEMFPSDPAGRTRYRDAHTEFEVLNMFKSWADDQTSCWLHTKASPGCCFQEGLITELQIDLEDVGEEYEEVKQSLTGLQTWQKTYLDMDGELKFAEQEIANGKDIFWGTGGGHARVVYENRLARPEHLPWPLKHDLETWESFQLDDDGCGTSKIRAKPAACEQLFTGCYFGGVEARAKWSYLVLEVHEKIDETRVQHLTALGMDPLGTWQSRRGYPQWALDSARAVYDKFYVIDSWPLEHNIETWERFNLSGGRIREDKLEAPKNLFEAFYFGGLEAREKWGYLLWEYNLDSTGNPPHEWQVQDKIRQGRDIFGSPANARSLPAWARDSAKLRYLCTLETGSKDFAHDLETWERFHLDEDGKGTTKIKRDLGAGKEIFEISYFGGVEARSKWGYLRWELDCRHELERGLQLGVDVFGPKSYYKASEQCPQWAHHSALERWHCLVSELSFRPWDDNETWERFHLDQDGTTTKAKVQLRLGIPLFDDCCYGGLAAQHKWGYLRWELENGTSLEAEVQSGAVIPVSLKHNFKSCSWEVVSSALARWKCLISEEIHQPKHDIETWERFHLGENRSTTKVEEELSCGLKVFSDEYFGGVEARLKWGYLEWEFDQDTKLKVELESGLDSFGPQSSIGNQNRRCSFGYGSKWKDESALARWQYLISEIADPPEHDLKTWERFHLDEDGKTTKIKMALHRGIRLFEPGYFGGLEARSKWGHLAWENRWLPDPRKKLLEEGHCSGWDIFVPSSSDLWPDWAGALASLKYRHLLDNLSSLPLGKVPLDNLKTWEEFHLDDDGMGTTKIKEKLMAGVPIFEDCYFGAVEARQKWAYIEWERHWLDTDGNTTFVEQALRDGKDVFAPSSFNRLQFPQDAWPGEFARPKYAHLLSTIAWLPKHDLVTWERFHLNEDGDRTAKIRAALAANEPLFEACYFGGVEARQKWGYLQWEHHWLDGNGGTLYAEEKLRCGRDIFMPSEKDNNGHRLGRQRTSFQIWAGDSARHKYGHLLDKLPCAPKHDLETWEWFHFSDGEGALLAKLKDNESLLSDCYFGGVAARRKYRKNTPVRMMMEFREAERLAKLVHELREYHGVKSSRIHGRLL